MFSNIVYFSFTSRKIKRL